MAHTEDEAQAAAARRDDYVRALKEERAGYVLRGLNDRVAEVDAQLARFAPTDATPAKRSTRKA